MARSIAKDPGTVLKSFLEEYQLNPSRLGKEVDLSQSTIRQITLNKLKISIPIALKFSKFFGNPVDFWIDLQTKHSLAEAAADQELNESLKQIHKAQKPAPLKAASKVAAKAALRGRPKKDAAENEKAKPAKSSAPQAAKRVGRPPKIKKEE